MKLKNVNPKIGFIGLRIVGKPMTQNLIKAEYALVVYNRSQLSVNELTKMNAQFVASPADVPRKSEVMITMLLNLPDLESVILGQNGILEAAKAGTTIID